MNARGKPYKVIDHHKISVALTASNLKKLQRYQGQLQESRGLKASANSIINECLHKYLPDGA